MLALDVGSSSVRAQLYDERANPALGLAPIAQVQYRWATTADGGMEVSAAALFGHVADALDAAVAEMRRRNISIRAVATACFWHSVLGVDARGECVTPVYAWGDTRSTQSAMWLRDNLDAEAAHRRTGCFFHSSYPTAKLPWLRANRAETFARAAAWAGFPEYLFARLFGPLRYSVSMASATGLLDVHRLVWDPAILQALELPAACLPEIIDVDTPFAGLQAGFARRWPELHGVPWLPPLGDGACANVGSGAVGRDRVGLTVGTSAALRVLWAAEQIRVPAGLWAYRMDRHHWVVGGALSNGGNAFAHAQQTLQLPAAARQEEMLALLEPDAHGLTVLPFLAGERSPGWHADARAAVVGTTQGTTPLHLLQAWLEAVAYPVGRVHDTLRQFLGSSGEIIAGGGALDASPYWTQLMADVLGRPLVLSAEPETTLRGAAVAALRHLGLVSHLGDVPVPRGPVFQPDARRHACYATAAERQRSLEAVLLPWLENHPAGVPADH